MTEHSLAELYSTDAQFLANYENGSREWLDLRATGLGGSDAGTILGLNPYESPFTLWAKKTGRITSDIPQNEAMEWGNRLEPVVLDKFEEERQAVDSDFQLFRNVGTWTHPERPWQIANPDGIFADADGFGIVEIKTAQFEDAWRSPDGEPGVPRHYYAQVQFYLNTFGYAKAWVAVLFHGNRFRTFEVLADVDFQTDMVARVAEFRDLIASDTQPEFDGALSTYTTLRSLHPQIEDGETELGWLGVEYFNADATYRAAESELNKVKSYILDAMGTSKRGLVDGAWTFTRQARGQGDPYLVVKRG